MSVVELLGSLRAARTLGPASEGLGLLDPGSAICQSSREFQRGASLRSTMGLGKSESPAEKWAEKSWTTASQSRAWSAGCGQRGKARFLVQQTQPLPYTLSAAAVTLSQLSLIVAREAGCPPMPGTFAPWTLTEAARRPRAGMRRRGPETQPP